MAWVFVKQTTGQKFKRPPFQTPCHSAIHLLEKNLPLKEDREKKGGVGSEGDRKNTLILLQELEQSGTSRPLEAEWHLLDCMWFQKHWSGWEGTLAAAFAP